MTKPGPGHGCWTPRKVEGGYRRLYRKLFKISKARQILPYPVWVADLTAGPGWYPSISCPGSPVVLWQEAIRARRPLNAYFCDEDPDILSELADRIRDVGPGPAGEWPRYHACNNALVLAEFAAAIRAAENPAKAVGWVTLDFNGLKTKDLPLLDALARFGAEFGRVDLIFNFNLSLFARFDGCKKSRKLVGGQRHLDKPALHELIVPGAFGKRNWLVRNPPPRKGPDGKWSHEAFVTLIGSSYRFWGRDRWRDFFNVRTLQGQQVVYDKQRVIEQQRWLDF